MTLILYNTLSRQKETFVPQDPHHVRFYVCGPTVYDRAHLGNARPVVVFDVLFRLLQQMYPRVTYARNITDVDDKIIKAALEKNISIDQLTTFTTQQYNDDMAALNALPPTVTPKATQHIGEMQSMIQTLIDQGFAYEKDQHVLFDVPRFSDYGLLSRLNLDDQIAGARVDVAPYKKNPQDFVLWKPSTPDQPGWDSPWGRGRPGWHIECSAMAKKHLGETFDIHGGGIDLVFPHHENEIAQSQCANHGTPLATLWMHNGHLIVNGEKMSKSLGNFFTVHDLLATIPGEVIRLTLLSAHYRQPLDWSDATVLQSKNILDRFYTALEGLAPDDPLIKDHIPDGIFTALKDDLNIPEALAVLHDLVSQIHKTKESEAKKMLQRQLKAGGHLLGFFSVSTEEWFQRPLSTGLTSNEIETLIQRRQAARAAKDFATSDAIRQQLDASGIILEDSPQGTTWKRK